MAGIIFIETKNEAELQRVLKKKNEKSKNLDKIRGSLIGGAGDALEYPVEFLRDEEIFQKYGKKGITEYDLSDGIAQISDDTQMTLFTANGILVEETRAVMGSAVNFPTENVLNSYQDWLITQEKSFEQGKNTSRHYRNKGVSWLLDVPELYARRAPENACLSALKERKYNFSNDFLDFPINDSKSCGALTRIAPLGLHDEPRFNVDWPRILQKKAAELSAITHGHSLGYMSSAVLTHIINQIVYPNKEKSLREIIADARDTASKVFAENKHLNELTVLVNKAMELSENDHDDLENIRQLGEGWVAEETLAIAIYCCLRYENDFSKGIIAAVNHSGDSDSTAAVTGNILGALHGYEAIDEKWKVRLELKDVILEMADDLCFGCSMCEYNYYLGYHDEDWWRKYMYAARWK